MGKFSDKRYVYQWELDGKRRPLPSLSYAIKKYGFEPLMRPRYAPNGKCEWCGKVLTGRRTSVCCDDCRRVFSDAVTWHSRGGYGQHILRRDNFTCQDCGEFHAYLNSNGLYVPASDGELEIHHIVPVSVGGGDEPGNLVTLCKQCHKDRHKNMDAQKELSDV